ncbi:unnamed protein product [Orchesella dallaii]|uniref:Uncharacterized protein n=1 Tax=Orchesella dallaii TaxID=48710 RepID=A0ABP1PJY6_9HEXA
MPLVEALRKTEQKGVASVLEEIIPSTSTSNESSSSFNSEIPENEENHASQSPHDSSFPADHNNNETSFNRNILRFISKSQESDIISLTHSFMKQSLETPSIKIIHTLDTYITSYKLTASKDISVNSVYYPFHEGETFSRNPKQLNIVTLTTTHSLLSLLHDISHLKNLKAVILTSETLKKIRQTVDDFMNSLNSPPPAITTTTDEIKWTDLTPEGKEQLLSKTVKFQETDVRFGDLHDDPKYFENLGSSFIINLLYGGQQPPTLFRKSGKDPPKEYICRQIHPRCYLAVEILNEANIENVFLVSGMSNGALGLKQLTTRIKVGHSHQQLKFSKLTKNLISLDENAHFKEICRRAGTATVFWFEAHEMAKSMICLEFKQAHPEKADLSLIQNWADKRTGMRYGIAEECFLGGILTSRKPVCIADVPGMGKSALLFKAIERIKQEFPTRFVHYSTMPDFMKNVELVMARRGIEGETIRREHIIEAISEAASDITFERNLLRKLLEPMNESVTNVSHIRCELMLDGLDEIVVEDQKSLSFQIINKIKTQLVTTTRLWLTIRKHMVQKMENQLHIMGCTLTPFSIKDQANYLVSRWTNKQLKKNTEINLEGVEIQNKFRQFAHACIRKVKQGLEEGKESFSNGASPYGAVGLELAGNPLQCRLIASNYFGKALSYATSCDEKKLLSTLNEFKKTMSITELYESIVKKKLDTFLKKNHAPEDKNRFRNLYKPTENEFYTKHMVLAVQIMFPEEAEKLFNLSPEKEKQDIDSDPEFSNFGILSNVSTKSFEFVHRTYAEYFVARFVVEFEEKFRGISKASHEATRKCMAEFVVKKVLSCPNGDGGFLPALWQKVQLNRPYFNYPIVVYFLNDMLGNKNMKQPSKDFKTELDKAWMKDREAGAYEYWTLMRPPVFFAAILSNYLYVAKLYYEAFDKKELFRKKTKASHRDMIILAVERGDYEFVLFISEQIIGRKVKKILNSKDRTVADIFKTSKHSTSGVLAPLRPKTNPLYAALSRGDKGIVDYLMHSQGFGVNTWESLQSRHHGKNVLHVLLRDSWEDDENKIEQKLDLVDIVLTECNQNGIDLTEEDEVGRPPILQPKAHVNLAFITITSTKSVLLELRQTEMN